MIAVQTYRGFRMRGCGCVFAVVLDGRGDSRPDLTVVTRGRTDGRRLMGVARNGEGFRHTVVVHKDEWRRFRLRIPRDWLSPTRAAGTAPPLGRMERPIGHPMEAGIALDPGATQASAIARSPVPVGIDAAQGTPSRSVTALVDTAVIDLPGYPKAAQNASKSPYTAWCGPPGRREGPHRARTMSRCQYPAGRSPRPAR